jgi:hypothetical protein
MSKQRSCGKRRFRDKQQALRALRTLQRVGSRQKIPVRAYQCPACNGWHLTSKAHR